MIEFYIQDRENEPAVRIDVDLSLAEEEMHFTKPLLLWVFVKMQTPDDSGLCSAGECELLQQLRDNVAALLQKQLDARFSGSRMSEGWFELYFYARSGKKLIAATGEAMQDFPGYTFDTGSSRDEEWSHYENELYPDTVMLHQIQNRHIIDELLEAGDDITVPREVEHYLFFQLPAQQQRAVERLEMLGYRAAGFVEQEGDYCHGAIVSKVQPVDEKTMTETVSELLDAASAEHGHYEGWSTAAARETTE
jgi:regulator of RNase E activity RraB